MLTDFMSGIYGGLNTVYFNVQSGLFKRHSKDTIINMKNSIQAGKDFLKKFNSK